MTENIEILTEKMQKLTVINEKQAKKIENLEQEIIELNKKLSDFIILDLEKSSIGGE